MHLIEEVLKQNKKVLYLVPEITLVAPTVRYLKAVLMKKLLITTVIYQKVNVMMLGIK